jgi:hypothetical protein
MAAVEHMYTAQEAEAGLSLALNSLSSRPYERQQLLVSRTRPRITAKRKMMKLQ